MNIESVTNSIEHVGVKKSDKKGVFTFTNTNLTLSRDSVTLSFIATLTRHTNLTSKKQVGFIRIRILR